MLPSDENAPATEMSQPANLNKDAGTPLQNPLHNIYREHLAPQNGAIAANGVSQQPGTAPQPPISASGSGVASSPLPSQALPQASQQAHGEPDDETIWIQRTKDVVEQTQNDPYKRLQMIQQLQAQYQSEHFRKDNGGVVGS